MKGCPHSDIRFCPLYVAAHDPATPFGCDDGELGSGECAAARGLSYEREIELMRIQCPRLIAKLDWNAALEGRRIQQERNQRLNGIH